MANSKFIENNEHGSALISVIVFITIVLFFISIMILYNHLQFKNITQYGMRIQTHHNAKSAILILLNQHIDKKLTPGNYYVSVNKDDSTVVEVVPWGLYLKIKATSTIKSVRSARTFLIGKIGMPLISNALVIGDTRNPLIFTGNTFVSGDALVGPQGIRPGVLKGIRYKGTHILDGSMVKDSHSYLPKFQAESILNNQIYKIKSLNAIGYRSVKKTENHLALENQTVFISQSDLDDLIKNGVNKIVGPGILMANENLVFKNLDIYNQVQIVCGNEVTFLSPLHGEHLLVFAKKIYIDGPCVLRGQFYANLDLAVENGAEFNYPSIVGLILENSAKQEQILKIGKNIRFEGIVLVSDLKETDSRLKYMLKTDPGSIILGMCYSGLYSELHGTVYGTVMTRSFYLYERPTIYINWLKDAVINRKLLQDDIALPLGFDINSAYTIIQEI